MERDFLYLACETNSAKGGKTVHLIQVEVNDGIWCRVDTAGIEDEAWDEAVVCEELAVLG